MKTPIRSVLSVPSLLPLFCVISIAGGLLGPISAQAAKPTASPTLITERERMITVTGRARVDIPKTGKQDKPKQFMLDLSIQITGAPSIKKALDQDRAFIAAIKTAAAENLLSLNSGWFSIIPSQPSMEAMPIEMEAQTKVAVPRASVPVASTFDISHSLSLIVESADLEAASEIAYAAMSLSEPQTVITVNNISENASPYYYPDTTALLPDEATEAQALKLAIANATAKAESVAKLLNVRLGTPVQFGEYGNVMTVMENGSATPKFVYSLDVSVSYALLDNPAPAQR